MLIGAGRAPWHYILLIGGGSVVGDLADGGRQSDADGAKGKARGGARRRAQDKAFAVLFDLGLGQRVEIGQNGGPRIAWRAVAVGLAEVRDTVLQLLFQHEGEEAARHVTANGL